MPEITVRCTPENAAEFRAMVAACPELEDLVRDLQAQDMFPGLRAMQVRLSADSNDDLQGGVGAWVRRQQQGGST